MPKLRPSQKNQVPSRMMGHKNDGSLNRLQMRFLPGTIAMSIIEPSLFLVFERFPDHKEAVKALYRESEDFQSLCEDYRQCAVALRYWSRSSEEHAPARRDEYTLLLQELEEELTKILKVSEDLYQ